MRATRRSGSTATSCRAGGRCAASTGGAGCSSSGVTRRRTGRPRSERPESVVAGGRSRSSAGDRADESGPVGPAVLGSGLDLRAQARRHPLHRHPGPLRREPDVAHGAPDERPVPRDRRGARARADARTSSSTERSWRCAAASRASSCSSSATARRVPVYYYVFDMPRLDGEDLRAAAAPRAQGAPPAGARVPGPDPLQPAPEGRARRGALPRGVPEGARGRDRQARRQPVHGQSARATG